MATQAHDKGGRRNALRLYFQTSPELDFNTQVLLGYASAGGAAVGEVLYALSQVEPNDLETWVRAWLDMAARAEGHAQHALAGAHRVSAREAFLRASTYYRAATFCLGVHDPRLEAAMRKLRACFAEAASLFDPPFEPVAVPFEGTHLPGYFLRPSYDAAPRPTLIMIGGGETFHEELYFWTGAAGRKRGWNVLLIDLPGQGGTAYQGMTYRPDVEGPFRTVMDALLARPEVNPRQVTAYGISLGGYLVLRAAATENRLAAVAASTPMPDVHRWLLDGLPLPLHRLPGFVGDAVTRLAGRFEPQTRIAIEKWLHHVGTDNLAEAVERFQAWRVDVRQITCPVLCLVGEGEAPTFHTQTRLAYEQLVAPKALRTTTVAEGADGHCQSNNFPLSQQLVFDWFEETLAAAVPQASTGGRR